MKFFILKLITIQTAQKKRYDNVKAEASIKEVYISRQFKYNSDERCFNAGFPTS